MGKRIFYILLILNLFLSYSYSEGSEVKISVKTKSYLGKYWRKYHSNVTAVWIENSEGKLVKTLKAWTSSRKDKLYLYEWQEKLGDIDARTSASRKRHGLIELSWDLTDYLSQKVLDGEYFACVEIAEDKGKGKVHKVKFVLGDNPVSILNNENKYFKDFKVEYNP